MCPRTWPERVMADAERVLDELFVVRGKFARHTAHLRQKLFIRTAHGPIQLDHRRSPLNRGHKRLFSVMNRTLYDLEHWRHLLTQNNDDRLEHKYLASQMGRLYETGTDVLPKSSANSSSPVYLSNCLDLSKCHEECTEDAFSARDVFNKFDFFKQFKNNRIGTTFPNFWDAFADFIQRQDDHGKARDIRAEMPKWYRITDSRTHCSSGRNGAPRMALITTPSTCTTRS